MEYSVYKVTQTHSASWIIWNTEWQNDSDTQRKLNYMKYRVAKWLTQRKLNYMEYKEAKWLRHTAQTELYGIQRGKVTQTHSANQIIWNTERQSDSDTQRKLNYMEYNVAKWLRHSAQTELYGIQRVKKWQTKTVQTELYGIQSGKMIQTLSANWIIWNTEWQSDSHTAQTVLDGIKSGKVTQTQRKLNYTEYRVAKWLRHSANWIIRNKEWQSDSDTQRKPNYMEYRVAKWLRYTAQTELYGIQRVESDSDTQCKLNYME